MENIIVAVISGLCVAIPSIITTISSNKSNQKLVLWRIEELEKKVSKHNNVVERMAIAERDIKTVFKRIDEIKGR